LTPNLLLACTAAESGYTVVIGYKKQLLKFLDELPPVFFFDKICRLISSKICTL
jgi:hypothetical protein